MEYLHKVVRLNHGKQLPDLLRRLGWAYIWIAGFHEKATYYFEEAFKLDGDTNEHYHALSYGERVLHNYEKSIELQNKNYANDSDQCCVFGLVS